MRQSNRRQFLKGSIAGLGALVTAHISGIFPEVEPILAQTIKDVVPISRLVDQEISVGESFAGFYLLPEGTSIPSFIQESKLGVPVVCGIGANIGGTVATAITELFNKVEDLKEVVDFPIYTFKEIPEGLRLLHASVLSHKTGEVFAVSVDFQTYNNEANNWQTTVSIWAEPDFPQPFPLWSSEPSEEGGSAIVLEKVDFLPTPGIMVSTADGYVCHWIEGGVLYFMIAENSTSPVNVQLMADKLTAF